MAVLVEPLLERLRTQEPHVPVLRVEGMDLGEHCE
jgi:hypothetical protein